jgi:hypothetical protein
MIQRLIKFRTSVITNSISAMAKDAVIVDGIIAQIAAADAHHVAGHGLGGLEWVEKVQPAQRLAPTVEVARPGAGGDGDDHRLAHRARHGDDQRRRQPESAAGTTMRIAVSSRVAPSHRRLAQRAGHGAQRILAHRTDQRHDQDADHDARRSDIEDLHGSRPQTLCKHRRHETEGKVTKDHRRDAGQDFQHRLEDAACARRRVLAQIDGNHHAPAAAPPPTDGSWSESWR